jgi:hypothetical protein
MTRGSSPSMIAVSGKRGTFPFADERMLERGIQDMRPAAPSGDTP